MKAVNEYTYPVLEDSRNVRLVVRRLTAPDAPGTEILREFRDEAIPTGIRFISSKKAQLLWQIVNPSMIKQKGFAARLFALCAELGVSVGTLSGSDETILFETDTMEPEQQNALYLALCTMGKVSVQGPYASVIGVGEKFHADPGIYNTTARALSNIHYIPFAVDASRNQTFLVQPHDRQPAIQALHSLITE
jgi:aspartokinase